MTDRYTLGAGNDQIFQATNLQFASAKPIYNASPTKRLPVILAAKPTEIVLARWGFISGLSNNRAISTRLINLSAELAFEKAPYQRMLSTKRAVVLADGFYLWKQVSRKQRIPYYFYFKDRRVFGIGAVWEQDDFAVDSPLSFNLLTQHAKGFIREYQEDFPLVLPKEAMQSWLADNSLADLKNLPISFDPKQLALHPVSPLIADPDQEGEKLIAPAQPADQYGNYTLFS